MWARIENERIKLYPKLKQGYESKTGRWIDFDTRSESVHQSEGFFLVVVPDFDNRIEELGPIEFQIDKFTYPVILKTLILAKVQAVKRIELDAIIDEVQGSIKRYLRTLEHQKLQVPTGVQDRLDAFYAKVKTWNKRIDDETDPTVLLLYSFPKSTIDNFISQLEEYRG